MKRKLVWITKVQSRNFVTDFGASLKNIIGGRLRSYEKMTNEAIEEAQLELFSKHPLVEDIKMQITEFTNKSVMVTIYGTIIAE
jgi:uncharacterized protein YbjQ (UPF0145 family)